MTQLMQAMGELIREVLVNTVIAEQVGGRVLVTFPDDLGFPLHRPSCPSKRN